MYKGAVPYITEAVDPLPEQSISDLWGAGRRFFWEYFDFICQSSFHLDRISVLKFIPHYFYIYVKYCFIKI